MDSAWLKVLNKRNLPIKFSKQIKNLNKSKVLFIIKMMIQLLINKAYKIYWN